MGKLTAWLGRAREPDEEHHAAGQEREVAPGSPSETSADAPAPPGEGMRAAAAGPSPEAPAMDDPPSAPMPGLSGAADATSEPTAPGDLEPHVIDALKAVYDPEIPVNIYDLGLIYRIDVSPEGDVEIDMTLTAPGCPVAQTFPMMVEQAVEAVPGVRSARVEIVWDPPWTPERMSEAARLELGWL